MYIYKTYRYLIGHDRQMLTFFLVEYKETNITFRIQIKFKKKSYDKIREI